MHMFWLPCSHFSFPNLVFLCFSELISNKAMLTVTHSEPSHAIKYDGFVCLFVCLLGKPQQALQGAQDIELMNYKSWSERC